MRGRLTTRKSVVQADQWYIHTGGALNIFYIPFKKKAAKAVKVRVLLHALDHTFSEGWREELLLLNPQDSKSEVTEATQ